MRALAIGNERRLAVAELKRKIRAGEVDAIDLVEGVCPEHEFALSHAKLYEFLLAIPRVGERTVHELLIELRMSGNLRFRSLSEKRRMEVAGLLRLIKWRANQ